MTSSEKIDYFTSLLDSLAPKQHCTATNPLSTQDAVPVKPGITSEAGTTIPLGYWSKVETSNPVPSKTISPSLEEELTKELITANPFISLAVEEEINYAKYQTQIKEKAEEFLKSFDNGKFAKKTIDQKDAKLEELKQAEDLKKDRETQMFTTDFLANYELTRSSEGKKSNSRISLIRTPGKTKFIVKNSVGHEIDFLFTNDQTREEKAERLNHILAVGAGKITEQTLLKITTPELTIEDINYWIDHYFIGFPFETPDPHVVKSKKQIQTNKDVEKISRLLADNKLQIKDLDKYVALGLISSAGLKAWRIQDQANNNYFYGDFYRENEGNPEAVMPELATAYKISDEKFKKLVGLTFPAQFEIEAQKAAFRVAGIQLNNVTRAAIIKAMPDDKAEGMKSFLASELGNSFVGMVGGVTLTHAMANSDMAQNLAKELRVASLATLGNEALDVLTKGMSGIITNTIRELPEVSKEISIKNETIEEDLEFLREEKIRQKIMN